MRIGLHEPDEALLRQMQEEFGLHSKAGDAVTLRAEMDLVMVVTACSMDNPPVNGAIGRKLRL